jgi:hypothetical protein
MTFPHEATGNFTIEVIVQLNDSQKERLRKFINLYFLGDEIVDETKPEIHSKDYKEAIARSRCDWPLVLSVSFDHNAKPCIQIKTYQQLNEVDLIKKSIKCSLACAQDIWELRQRLEWTPELEEEIIELHGALPENVNLLKNNPRNSKDY